MPANRGRILVVDDEVALLTVMEQYLSRLGYDVVARRSGQEAWHTFAADPSAFALVVVDVSLPEMSGQELLLRMLELNPDICILICSGYPLDPATVSDKVRCPVEFLQKPFTPRMLSEAVERLLAARRGPLPA